MRCQGYSVIGTSKGSVPLVYKRFLLGWSLATPSPRFPSELIDEKIFCMHGGLSPDINSMDQIRRILRPTDIPDQGNRYWKIFNCTRSLM